jgi:hypothetical protein
MADHRRGGALVAGLALCVAAATPAAARERLALSWTAPAGCPDAAAVRTEVHRLLGGEAHAAARVVIVTAVVVEERPGAWQVTLETPRAGGIRVVRGSTCAAIGDAAAVILALMIDPTAVLEPRRPPASAPARRAASQPATAPQPPPRPPAPPASPRPRRVAGRVAVFGGVDVTSLPGTSPGVGGSGALQLGRQRLELGFEYWTGARGHVAARPAAGGDLDLWLFTLSTCRALLAGRVELGPCLGLDLGRLHGSGFGVARPGEGAALWVALRGGVLASWEFARRWALFARLEAVIPLQRPRFVLTNVGPVYRPAAAGERSLLGLERRF